jgi:hypothetical protein
MHKHVFDSSNLNWNTQMEANLIFLRGMEQYFNNQLRKMNLIFRNEVYSALGLPRTKEGQVEGWSLYETDEHDATYVQFKLYPDFDLKRIVIQFEDNGEIVNLLPAEAS